MKKLSGLIIVLCLSALLSATNAAETAKELDHGRQIRAVIETGYGNIELKLFSDVAPKNVENFVKLAKEGFYDGTTFHAAVRGLVIQGGDPNTKISRNTYTGCCPDKSRYGLGGPGWTIPAEFSNIRHKRGIVSMVRFQHPDSAGSQFFIVVKDSHFLDDKFTVIGEVTSGMDVVDKIINLEKIKDMAHLLKERVEMKVEIIE